MLTVETVFERMPELFVRVYRAEFDRWGRDFAKVGKRLTLRLRTPLRPHALAIDQRAIVGVVLVAEIERDLQQRVKRIVVRAADAANSEAIARHTVDLRRAVS